MIYTEKTKLAMRIAYNAHNGQVDKGGVPYIFHPFHLAEQMETEDETITALLHDVIEDTNVTIRELEKYGFSENVIKSIKVLTHDKNITYFEYINNIKENSIARKVKIADLEHNMNLTRINNITEKDRKRLEKYKESKKILEIG